MAGDVPAHSDYDGDGLTDFAVWRPSAQAVFYVLQSATNTFRGQPWGIFGAAQRDKPRPADYDGDGKTDFAVYRRGISASEQSFFWILSSLDNSVKTAAWGLGNDISTVGDFDGDRVADLTVIRNIGGQHVYFTRQSSDGAMKVQQWGASSQHYAMTGDFDGDGKDEPVAFTFIGQNVGTWWVLGSSAGVFNFKWGNSNDDSFCIADYDGDNQADATVYRDGNTFFIRRSTNGTMLAARFGTGVDVPTTRFPF